MRIAFHTPLNLFDDGGVSGDRRMARQLVAALRSLGHEVDPVVAPRGYLPSSDAACLAEREERAAQLRGDLLRHWRSGASPAPDLWFTYHNYYRAPDLLGPALAAACDIPYVTAEASDAPRLVTIAMMREGTKQNSYLALARILALIQDEDWRLSIIGDGRQRAAIEQAFATLPAGRVTFLGLLDRDGAMQELAAHDIFVWPGIREAYGLVYLEAQAVGLPIIAFDSGGVADTVDAGRTALLVEEGNEAAFAARLSALLADPARRRRLGDAARRFALTERSPQKAAERLAEGLALALENHRAKRKEAER